MQNRKWNVLIVDDEIRIAKMIQKLIKWDELQLECAGLVDNGETAYRMILEQSPDIVITDIRMPKISGLELIEKANESHSVKFIVISGFKEFEYAQKALQNSVRDYLLKPVNEEELNQTLKKITIELSQDYAFQHKEEQMMQIITASEHILKRTLLGRMLDQSFSITRQEIEQKYAVSFPGNAFRCLAVKLDCRNFLKTESRLHSTVAEKLISLMEESMDRHCRQVLVCEKENLYIYCLLNYRQEDSREIKNGINDLLSVAQAYLLKFDQYDITIGIGREKFAFEEAAQSAREARHSVDNRIRVGTGRLIYARYLAFDAGFSTQAFLEPFKPPFRSALEIYSGQALSQCIGSIYDSYCSAEEYDGSRCYQLAKEIIDLFFDHVKARSEEENSLKNALLAQYLHCGTLPDLKNFLCESLGEYLQKCLTALESESAKPVRQAKQYILEHYSEKIILEDLAELVHLNPVYLSVLFKKETGITIVGYLINVRMDAAKEMLRTTNETISAIGARIGYKDTRYFSQLFTKTVGIKPALYRKMHA